jgi:MFS transporter, NNP family, nitrate/nitrite transporter
MSEPSSAKLQLALGTGAFALCFAVFGSMSAMMPIISRHMALSPVQKSIAIALPVLLGSLGRIPLGILTDRFGGRDRVQLGHAVLHHSGISDGRG